MATVSTGLSNGHHHSNKQVDKTSKYAIVAAVCYVSGLLLVFFLVNDEVPQPYMDEIFHVDQARSYCVGNFSYVSTSFQVLHHSHVVLNYVFHQWNKKITTPPGLYLTTLGFLKPFSELYAFGEEAADLICPTTMLRFINIIFGVANAYLIFLINWHQYKSIRSHSVLVVSSIAIALFPCLYFFNFLFYTDSGSVFFVLLMYFHHLNHQEWLAAVFGLMSLLFRQTNIVWVFFIAAKQAITIIQISLPKMKKKSNQKQSIIVTFLSLVVVCGGYALVGLAFLMFLVANRGIVLGDKAAHQATLNIPQLFYFFGFCAFFGIPWFSSYLTIKDFVKFVKNNRLLIVMLTTATGFLLKTMATVHPYLLADNRHYTFYVWRKILDPSNIYSLYTLPFIFVYAGFAFFNAMPHKDTLWKCLFLFCIAVSVVPQKLLEFRYFVTPFIMWRLNVLPADPYQMVLELVLNTIQNLCILYLFLFEPFYWDHDDYHEQRFMW